jgi:hypothetical protein
MKVVPMNGHVKSRGDSMFRMFKRVAPFESGHIGPESAKSVIFGRFWLASHFPDSNVTART